MTELGSGTELANKQ